MNEPCSLTPLVEVDPTVVKFAFGIVLADPSFGALLPVAVPLFGTSNLSARAPLGLGDEFALQLVPETAAPAALSFAKGSPQIFKDWKASFVDGAGGQSMFPRMWERMKPMVDGYIVVSLDETKEAMRLMAERTRIISEGAGALPVAAALSGKAGNGPIVAIVSGGNIDIKKFCELIA